MSSNLLKDKENSFNLSKRLEEFGITRLADTTGLDYINIPTSSCVCPGTTDAIWVYSGKGTTPERSRISAIISNYLTEEISDIFNHGYFSIVDIFGSRKNFKKNPCFVIPISGAGFCSFSA